VGARRLGKVCLYEQDLVFLSNEYILDVSKEFRRRSAELANDVTNQSYHTGCEEKHSNTTAHHPVVKPPAAASTAV